MLLETIVITILLRLGYFPNTLAKQTLSITNELHNIEEILSEHNHFKNSRCGNWKDQYLSQYERMIQQPSSQKKYLIAIPNLSGFTTAFTFALLTNRIFQIGHRYPLPPIEQVFFSPYINWTRDVYDPPWIIQPLEHHAKIRNYNSSILEQRKYFAVNTINDWKLQDRFLRGNITELLGGDYQSTFIVINRGKTIRIFENQHYAERLKAMGLTPHTAFGCFVDFLLKPKLSIFQSVWPQMQKLHQYTSPRRASSTLIIAIQIRTGDEYLLGGKSNRRLEHYSAFFSCAEQIERFSLADQRNFTNALWFLVTDSSELRRAAVEKYSSDKIITNLEAKIEHSSKESSVCRQGDCGVSKEGFSTAAAEWWLMSFARFHVVTEYSGYGRSAAMHSLFPDSIYTIRHGQSAAANPDCAKTSFTDLLTLSYDWSGV